MSLLRTSKKSKPWVRLTLRLDSVVLGFAFVPGKLARQIDRCGSSHFGLIFTPYADSGFVNQETLLAVTPDKERGRWEPDDE